MPTDDGGTARETLLAAFAREGIAYPASRLDEAVADFADLARKMALIRAACPRETEPAQCFVLAAGSRTRHG